MTAAATRRVHRTHPRGKRRPRRRSSRHPRSSVSLASALVYVFAAIISIALGAIFYSSYQRAHRQSAAARSPVTTALPPGATVIVRSEDGHKIIVSKSGPRSIPDMKSIAPQSQASPVRRPAPRRLPARQRTQAPPVTHAATAPPPVIPAPQHTPPTLALHPQGNLPPHLPPPPPRTTAPPPAGEIHTAKLMPTADTTIFCRPASLRTANVGSDPALRLQGRRTFAICNYDVSAIHMWTIHRAVWHAHLESGDIRELGFSTVPAAWVEGHGTFDTPHSDGAAYNRPQSSRNSWSSDATPLDLLVRGNGGSIYCTSPVELAEPGTTDMWISVAIDPSVVQAMVSGGSHGIAIFDETGRTHSRPAVIASRESRFSHYLEIFGSINDIKPPAEVYNLKCEADPRLRRSASVGVVLTWKAAGDDDYKGRAFRYDIRYSTDPSTSFETATPLPQNLLPVPGPPKATDGVVIPGLDPQTTYRFFIASVDEAGQSSRPAVLDYTTPALLELPAPAMPPKYRPGQIFLPGLGIYYSIRDPLSATDPFSKTVLSGNNNPFLWERDARTVHLSALRNESVAFLITFSGAVTAAPPLEIRPTPIKGPSVIPASALNCWRVVYHRASPGAGRRRIGDALVPLKMPFRLAAPPFEIAGQRIQDIYCQLTVPPDLPPGLYHGTLQISSRRRKVTSINLLLKIGSATIPAVPTFTFELVGPPDLASLYRRDPLDNTQAVPVEKAYVSLASANRAVFTQMPYSREGNCRPPLAPEIEGSGAALRVTDWHSWDERFSNRIQNAASPRAPASREVPFLVVPTFENWPASLNQHYHCADWEVPDPYSHYPIYAGASSEIPNCIDPEYWKSFRAALRAFEIHFLQNHWTNTAIHVWLNNIPAGSYNGKPPPWYLGAPVYRNDFIALERYAAAVAAMRRPEQRKKLFLFRVNVPDIAALGRYGTDAFDLLCVSDRDPTRWHNLRRRALTYNETIWRADKRLSPSGNDALIPGAAIAAFLNGADGWTILHTAGRAADWRAAVPESILYCGAPLRKATPLPSLRLKAILRAEQDIELLALLQQREHWTREQLRDFVQSLLGGGSVADASPADLALLRSALHQLLR